MIKLFPLIFVFLWSSAFITGKVVVFSSSPFAALSFRFAIVAFGFYLISLIFKNKVTVVQILLWTTTSIWPANDMYLKYMTPKKPQKKEPELDEIIPFVKFENFINND